VHPCARSCFTEDCLKIRSDLNKLAEWCELNALDLNEIKCKSLTLLKQGHPVEFLYMIVLTVYVAFSGLLLK
jgi:hypothetical protein